MYRVGAWFGRARSGGERIGHGVCVVGGIGFRSRAVGADHLCAMEFADRAVAARMVCVRPAMPVDAGGDSTRNQFLENARARCGVFICAGICCRFYYLSNRESLVMKSYDALQLIIVFAAVLLSG